MKKLIILILIIPIINNAYSEEYFDEAERLYLESNILEAKLLFELALDKDPYKEQTYLYLAMIYEMLKEYDKSLEILKKGLNYSNEQKYKFYYNMGNKYFTKNKYNLALEMYNDAITTEPRDADSYLNRGQTRIKLFSKVEDKDERVEYIKTIISDYRTYLVLKPTSQQREEIEKLLAKLNLFIRNKEAKEEELENLLEMLNNASNSTKNLSAGAEDIDVEYEEEDILD